MCGTAGRGAEMKRGKVKVIYSDDDVDLVMWRLRAYEPNFTACGYREEKKSSFLSRLRRFLTADGSEGGADE